VSYQVIARKYRPQKFSDVVGQEHVTKTLANAIKKNRIAHAYLFVGPRGTGKTTIARIFAKCLNCEDGPKVKFDDQDPRCLEIAEGRCLDVLEIDGASNRGIEEIRELRETVKYAPSSSKYKIFIIDEVHMLTKEAFNALLKTLEEPPEHVKFMFATTEAEKVIPTILSRCQRFDLRRIPPPLIVKHLAFIAKKEKVKIDEQGLNAIARGADGGMRDAESTLDQLISFCGAKITESDVLSMFGLTAQTQIEEMASAIINGDISKTLEGLNNISQNGKDLRRFLADLLAYFRNLLLFQVSQNSESLLDIPENEAKTIAQQTASISATALTRIMDTFVECESRFRDSTSKKILLEMTLVKAIEARNATSIDTVLERLQQLRTETVQEHSETKRPAPAIINDSASPAPPTSSEPQSKSQTIAPQPLPAGNLQATGASQTINPDEQNLNQLWTKLLEAIGRVSQFTRSYFLEAHPVSFENGILTIGFDPEFSDHISLVDNTKTRTLLLTKLSELGNPNAKVRFVVDEATDKEKRTDPAAQGQEQTPATLSKPEFATETKPVKKAPRANPQPIQIDKDEFKNDPLIQKALEIFKGKIVEVRK
jgi:DNA polymerase III subunit gamma/tau